MGAHVRLRTAAAAAVLATAAITVTALPAGAAPPSGAAANEYSYTVTASYQGRPENLWEIAERFLGDGDRAGEILARNGGRIQPDGERLADPSRLHEGWTLVLPWDAVGTELHYGALPAPAGASTCDQSATGPAPVDRAGLQPPLSQAWAQGDGDGVTVAILGSGVDGAAPALAGRVAAGTDVDTGAGRGDTVCQGTGTVLAGIVAGDREHSGVAPGARILPIRAADGNVPTAEAVPAIGIAAQSGARVLLIGAGVDGGDPAVRAAISDAIAHDVVVVVSAAVSLEPADGLLRVGTATAEAAGDPAELRAPGAADETGEGGGVSSDYAAAFVAGTVALVRSAHPDLTAAGAARQVRDTAAGGVVSPAAAVTTALPAGAAVTVGWSTPTGLLTTLSRVLIWAGAVLAALAVLGLLLARPLGTLGERLGRDRAHRRALAARARMSGDGNDPFWQPPGSGRP